METDPNAAIHSANTALRAESGAFIIRCSSVKYSASAFSDFLANAGWVVLDKAPYPGGLYRSGALRAVGRLGKYQRSPGLLGRRRLNGAAATACKGQGRKEKYGRRCEQVPFHWSELLLSKIRVMPKRNPRIIVTSIKYSHIWQEMQQPGTTQFGKIRNAGGIRSRREMN